MYIRDSENKYKSEKPRISLNDDIGFNLPPINATVDNPS